MRGGVCICTIGKFVHPSGSLASEFGLAFYKSGDGRKQS